MEKSYDHLKKIDALKGALINISKNSHKEFDGELIAMIGGMCRVALSVKNLKKFHKGHGQAFRQGIQLIARSNFIVNLVTSLEITLKQVINFNNIWDEAGINMLLGNEKINLNQAYHLFRKTKEKITQPFLITYFHSLHNYDMIDMVFTKLANEGDILNKVGVHTLEFDSKIQSLDTYQPNWKNDLRDLFAYRHDFVHNGVIVDCTLKRIKAFEDIVSLFPYCLEHFCLTAYAKKKSSEFLADSKKRKKVRAK